jgi:hypothetical protein
MTFPTSFHALLAMRDQSDGWNVPIAIGKSGMMKKSQNGLVFHAKSASETAMIPSDICIICFSSQIRRTYFTSPPW